MLKGYIRDTVQTKFTQQVVPTRAGRKQRKVKKYYNRQNALIDAYLGSGEEEQFEIDDALKNGGKVKFAVNASFLCNFGLFIIQMYAAVSTGSLSLFATAADAFMDLVSSIIMLITSRLAAKPNIHKFPVVCQSERTRQTLSLTIAGSQKSRDCRDHSLLCFDDYCLGTVDH